MRTKFPKVKRISKKRTEAELKLLQSLPLETKILWAQEKIKEWYEYHNGMVYVSFSGGKDSTVLLSIVRQLYPNIPAVFSDTGLEWPEVRDFVKTIDNVIWLKPKTSFNKVLEIYGYPLVSKKIAKMIRRLQNPTERNTHSNKLALTGLKRDGTLSKFFKLSQKWKFLIKAPFKVSEKCCDILKKEPFLNYEKTSNRKPYVGVMAQDSQQRKQSYLITGCNSFSTGKSQPLSIWKDEDIWEYIKTYKINYSKAYDLGERRTGCIFCCFGIDKDPNRFVRLYKRHPHLWKYCMENLKMKEVLDYCKIKSKPDGFFY